MSWVIAFAIGASVGSCVNVVADRVPHRRSLLNPRADCSSCKRPLSNKELARLRLESIGFVFQAFNLLPVLSALENAEFSLVLRGVPPEERHRRVRELFDEISPIEDFPGGRFELSFLDHRFGEELVES